MNHCQHNQMCGDAVRNQMKQEIQNIANESMNLEAHNSNNEFILSNAGESMNVEVHNNNNEFMDAADNSDNVEASFDFTCQDDNSIESVPDITNQRIFHANEDSSLLAQYSTYCKNGKDKLPIQSNQYKSAIDLLNILHTAAGSPLYLFDSMMKWAKTATSAHRMDFTKEIPKRETFIPLLINQFDYNLLAPIYKKVTLPGSQAKVEIVIHDFSASLYTLLCDDELMDISNLLLDENDIFKPPVKGNINTNIDDIDTGDVWYDAYQQYVKIEKLDILCPIIFFIDKTHTDNNQRLCIEQVRLTLGIFKRKVRNLSRAWRSIGYITDQAHIENLSTDKTAKMQDYQYMLEIILESYKKAQQNSIAWQLNVRGTLQKVSFLIPTLFIIGDTDGHDKLVGKFATRNANVKRLCRYCDCPFHETDNPFYRHTLTKADFIAKKIRDGKSEDLQNMSMHCVRNAWVDVQFCDVQRGIFGATPAESMHCLQQGLYQYIITRLFEQKKVLKKKRKKKVANNKGQQKKKAISRNSQEALEEYLSETDDDKSIDSNNTIDSDVVNWNENGAIVLSNRSVFSLSYSKHIDKIAKEMGFLLMHQSDRNLPRTHFPGNYTSASLKTANEMSGVFIVLLMVFSSSEGEVLDVKLGGKRSAQYIRIFEVMLMLEHFCKNEVHTRKDIKLFQKILKTIMSTLKETIARTEGNQMKIIKFHLPQHFAEDMIRFGSMANFDSGICEMHHKIFAKKPASNTQRRRNVFEKQAAKNQIENMAIERAIHHTYPERLKDEINTNETYNSGFTMEYDHAKHDLVYRKKKDKPKCKWQDVTFQKSLSSWCSKIIDSNALIGPIKFFTLHKRQGNLFRADPCYEKAAVEPWYDWVYIDWGDSENNCVPAKILIFMDIEEKQYLKRFEFGGSIVNEPGVYAIVLSFVSNDITLAHQASKLVEYGTLVNDINTQNPTIYAVSVDSIVKPCIAVPYNTEKSNIINANEWLILKSRDQWYDTFLEFMRDEEKLAKKKK
jgi:hypothetical protein